MKAVINYKLNLKIDLLVCFYPTELYEYFSICSEKQIYKGVFLSLNTLVMLFVAENKRNRRANIVISCRL